MLSRLSARAGGDLHCRRIAVRLARLHVARLCAIFPAAAIEGMLAAIGLLIIVKQIPLFSAEVRGHEFWEILAEVPSRLGTANVQVLGLGVACLARHLWTLGDSSRLLKVMPPAVWVFFLGTLLELAVSQLEPGLADQRAGGSAWQTGSCSPISAACLPINRCGSTCRCWS